MLDDGEWKFFTMQVCPDVVAGLGSVNPAADSHEIIKADFELLDMDADMSKIPGSGGLARPICDGTGHAHNICGLTQTVQNTVPWPEPYDEFDYNRSYRHGVNDWKQPVIYECPSHTDTGRCCCATSPVCIKNV